MLCFQGLVGCGRLQLELISPYEPNLNEGQNERPDHTRQAVNFGALALLRDLKHHSVAVHSASRSGPVHLSRCVDAENSVRKAAVSATSEIMQ